MKKKHRRRLEQIEGAIMLLKAAQRTNHDRWQSVQDDIATLVAQVGDLSDRFDAAYEKALNESIRAGAPSAETIMADQLPPETHFSTSSPQIVAFNEAVPISPGQARSMADGGGWLMGYDRSNGWLMIGNLGRHPDAEGNGCWHDVEGNEQHGPHGAFTS
jgi:hypothetical protein